MPVTRKRHLASSIVLLLALCSLHESIHASVIVTREFFSATLARKWSYAIYLPDGYEASRLRYPVFYLLHGNGHSMNEWAISGRIQATTDELISTGRIPPTIIVTPDAGTTWFVNRKENMETAFVQDLIADVESHLRTIATRRGRVIGGLSMGGYGALRFVLKYPDRFAAAALLSPAIYDPEPPENSGARRVGVFGAPNFDSAIWKQYNYPNLIEAYLAKQQPVPMYINSGDDDEYMIEAEAMKLYALLRQRGQPAELRILDGAHDWALWRATIGDAMTYLYRYAARPVLENEATRH